jgi:hypothetical protein
MLLGMKECYKEGESDVAQFAPRLAPVATFALVENFLLSNTFDVADNGDVGPPPSSQLIYKDG